MNDILTKKSIKEIIFHSRIYKTKVEYEEYLRRTTFEILTYDISGTVN